MKGRFRDNVTFVMRYPSLVSSFLFQKYVTKNLDGALKEKMRSLYSLEVVNNYELEILEKYLSADLRPYYDEILEIEFIDDIMNKLRNYNYGEGLGILDYTNCTILYCVIRHLKPERVVETGVASGASSYTILQALKMNGAGKLYSIDLPQNVFGNAFDMLTEKVPEGKKSGWLVPEDLKHTWTLIEGDSKTELPKLLESLERIDIFIHDSLHTYEHMMFEYQTAWKYIKNGGLLISDDAKANSAFDDFARKNGLVLHRLGFVIKNERLYIRENIKSR